ncbi:MAG TPA: hypothetical protein VG838_04835 [Opitutaceae bacterium]|nr:hypothetical protein [Opitutaceae bacterium]
MSDPRPSLPEELRHTRQKLTLIVLSTVLILGGFFVLLALRRAPLPARLVMGFGDFVGAFVLLTFLRQNYSGK